MDFGICLAIGKRDAGAICWWIGERWRTVAQLAVIAVPPAAKGVVAGADVAVVDVASAVVGASSGVATSCNSLYVPGPFLAIAIRDVEIIFIQGRSTIIVPQVF